MTIQECYRQMGANYEDVLKRLYNEGMICRFTLMFLNDDSYPKLEQALKEGNVKEAFRAAHTLKGVCQNLGFTNLYQPTYESFRSEERARAGKSARGRPLRFHHSPRQGRPRA